MSALFSILPAACPNSGSSESLQHDHAADAALQACREQGGRDCQSMITFKGGCAAAVAPDNGKGQLYFVSADGGVPRQPSAGLRA